MLDMSWGEVMVIGAVALIIIGPKDLPKALRTVGQVTGKLRRMAAEFQGQFNEAIREAELDDVKRQLQGVNESVSSLNTNFNPIQTIKDELKGAVETPVVGSEGAAAGQPAGTAVQAQGEAGLPVPVEQAETLPVPLGPPMDDDPAAAIAESLRREAEIEQQKVAAAQVLPERTEAKAE